ncbi:MAG: hypothetical protein FJ213_10010 [Ignavibacteria bacterium]|nr:hypothetical protein [Ignavibacteria bacterium]
MYLLERYSKKISFDFVLAKKRTEELMVKNIGVADSAHLTFAEQYSDILITCDNKFYKQAKKYCINIQIMNPVEFCAKELRK